MKYKTIIALPDSREKYLKLEKKLLRLQFHGPEFFEAMEEWRRLFDLYHTKEREEKNT